MRFNFIRLVFYCNLCVKIVMHLRSVRGLAALHIFPVHLYIFLREDVQKYIYIHTHNGCVFAEWDYKSWLWA